MFSLIQKVFRAAQSLDVVCERLTHLEARLTQIETKLDRFEKLADENESLWQFLDEQKEAEELFVTQSADFQDEISDILLRKLKPYGDA